MYIYQYSCSRFFVSQHWTIIIILPCPIDNECHYPDNCNIIQGLTFQRFTVSCNKCPAHNFCKISAAAVLN